MTIAASAVPANEFKGTALLTWPVVFDGRDSPVKDAHVTAFWWPYARFDQDSLLKVIRESPFYNDLKVHRVETVKGIEALGPEKQYPVLTLETPAGHNWMNKPCAYTLREGLASLMNQFYPDNTFPNYTPHVTVDVDTLVRPPSRVILKPLELWVDGEHKYVV